MNRGQNMNRKSKTSSLLLTACPYLVLGFASVAGAQDETIVDQVILDEGKRIEGTIELEDYDGISLSGVEGKKKQRSPWGAVVSVHYGDGQTLTEAIDAFAGGRFEECLDLLEQLFASDPPARPVILQQARFFQGLSLVRLGELDSALATFEKLVAEYPQGRYLRRAAEEVVGCHLAKNDPDGASAALDALIPKVTAQGPFQTEVSLVRAHLREVAGAHAEARALYQEVAGASGVSEAAVEQAELGVARTLLLEGSRAEAADLLRGLTTEAHTDLVLAGTWNGLGDLWREDGRQAKNQDRLLDAAFAYLRGVLLHPPEPGEPTTEHEHALGGVALVYKYLFELEQNPERKRINKDRFAERRAILLRDYPSSRWLQDLD